MKTHVTVEEAIGFLGDIEIQNGKVNDYIKVNDRKIYNHVASTKVGDKFLDGSIQLINMIFVII